MAGEQFSLFEDGARRIEPEAAGLTCINGVRL
jgi:hypothetical protein